MVVAARKDSETKVSLSFFFVCGLDFRKEHFPMPKTLPQRIVSPPKLFEQIPCFCLTTPAGVCYYIFAD